MWIYRHHTADDIIDLDDRSGRWTPVIEDEDNPIIIGQMTIAQRSEFYIRGSYTIEDDRRFYFYWNDENELVFRTDSARFALFRRDGSGAVIALIPELSVSLDPAMYGDGRAMPNMSTFKLMTVQGEILAEALYDSGRYLQYYMGNFTYVPDEDLSSWDFFLSVKVGIAELTLLAQAKQVSPSEVPRTWVLDEIITAQTGKRCPRAGIWAGTHYLKKRCRMAEGDIVPDIDGAEETWVWVSN